MKRFLIAPALGILCLLTLSGCREEVVATCEEHTLSPCTTDPAMVNIRVHNMSAYTLCNVEVGPGESTIFNHGIMEPHATTCYRATPTAYLNSYVHFMVGDSELVVQPIDHIIGDSMLDPGNFTLTITVNELKMYGGAAIAYARD
jgi:hypothetical protein